MSVSLRYGCGVGWERKGTKEKKMRRRRRKRWERRRKRWRKRREDGGGKDSGGGSLLPFDLGLSASSTGRNSFCCLSHPVAILFISAAQLTMPPDTKTLSR